jgi:hypothetical protein
MAGGFLYTGTSRHYARIISDWDHRSIRHTVCLGKGSSIHKRKMALYLALRQSPGYGVGRRRIRRRMTCMNCCRRRTPILSSKGWCPTIERPPSVPSRRRRIFRTAETQNSRKSIYPIDQSHKDRFPGVMALYRRPFAAGNKKVDLRRLGVSGMEPHGEAPHLVRGAATCVNAGQVVECRSVPAGAPVSPSRSRGPV